MGRTEAPGGGSGNARKGVQWAWVGGSNPAAPTIRTAEIRRVLPQARLPPASPRPNPPPPDTTGTRLRHVPRRRMRAAVIPPKAKQTGGLRVAPKACRWHDASERLMIRMPAVEAFGRGSARRPPRFLPHPRAARDRPEPSPTHAAGNPGIAPAVPPGSLPTHAPDAANRLCLRKKCNHASRPLGRGGPSQRLPAH